MLKEAIKMKIDDLKNFYPRAFKKLAQPPKVLEIHDLEDALDFSKRLLETNIFSEEDQTTLLEKLNKTFGGFVPGELAVLANKETLPALIEQLEKYKADFYKETLKRETPGAGELIKREPYAKTEVEEVPKAAARQPKAPSPLKRAPIFPKPTFKKTPGTQPKLSYDILHKHIVKKYSFNKKAEGIFPGEVDQLTVDQLRDNSLGGLRIDYQSQDFARWKDENWQRKYDKNYPGRKDVIPPEHDEPSLFGKYNGKIRIAQVKLSPWGGATQVVYDKHKLEERLGFGLEKGQEINVHGNVWKVVDIKRNPDTHVDEILLEKKESDSGFGTPPLEKTSVQWDPNVTDTYRYQPEEHLETQPVDRIVTMYKKRRGMGDDVDQPNERKQVAKSAAEEKEPKDPAEKLEKTVGEVEEVIERGEGEGEKEEINKQAIKALETKSHEDFQKLMEMIVPKIVPIAYVFARDYKNILKRDAPELMQEYLENLWRNFTGTYQKKVRDPKTGEISYIETPYVGWSPEGRASFLTYAKIMAKNFFKDKVNEQLSQSRLYTDVLPTSLSTPIKPGEDVTLGDVIEDVSSDPLDQITLADYYNVLYEYLPEESKEVYKEWMEGATIKDIATELHKRIEDVKMILQEGLKEAYQKMLEAGEIEALPEEMKPAKPQPVMVAPEAEVEETVKTQIQKDYLTRNGLSWIRDVIYKWALATLKK
jgi:DNA-directed RNA polymerase specialized sigma24 family protein